MRDPLEPQLADLATAIHWPVTPDVARAVGAAVRSEPAHRRGWGLLSWRPARRGLVLAVAGALLVAGVAVAAGLALGGLRIVFGEPSASLNPSAVAGRSLGEEMTLAEARSRAGFAVRVPALDALGDPDHVFFRQPPAGGQVALVWGNRPGFPADGGTGIGLVITEFRADIRPDAFEKLISAGVTVDAVVVDDAPGYWIEGGDHFIYYVDAEGSVVETTVRMVGRTLVWESGGLTLRIEGAPGLEDALRVAESMGE